MTDALDDPPLFTREIPSTSRVGSRVGEIPRVDQDVVEGWLIGAMLLSRVAIIRASWIVHARQFSKNRRVLVAEIYRIDAERSEVTPESVADALAKLGALDQVGGLAGLRQLVADIPAVVNDGLHQVAEWATSIADNAFAREMQSAATALLRDCLIGNRQQIAQRYAHIHALLTESVGMDHRAELSFLVARDRGTSVTALYRWYDADDLLLYIGITNDPHVRQSSHAKKSSWADFAVRGTIERYSSRPDAEAAEKFAIESERPLFNHQHNDTPEARQRLVAYLVEHGRMDLLAPAVSRG